MSKLSEKHALALLARKQRLQKYQAAHQAKKRAIGLCRHCGRPRCAHSRNYCAYHAAHAHLNSVIYAKRTAPARLHEYKLKRIALHAVNIDAYNAGVAEVATAEEVALEDALTPAPRGRGKWSTFQSEVERVLQNGPAYANTIMAVLDASRAHVYQACEALVAEGRATSWFTKGGGYKKGGPRKYYKLRNDLVDNNAANKNE